MVIAILALQGAFIEHEMILKKLNVDYFEIRKKEDLNKPMDGLIIPGGESTTIGKLLFDLDIFVILKNKIINGLPVFGTCAGMILLAKKIDNQEQTYFATMDIEVMRNAYGRQLGSFYTLGKFDNMENIKMTFIRAPYVKQVFNDAKVLSIIDNHIVAVRQGNQLAISFHPELTDEIRIHQYFINMIEENIKK